MLPTTNLLEPKIDLVRKYFENSMEINSPEYDRVRKAAKDNSIFVMFGFSERCHGTLFMAQSLISSNGDILLHRHKTKPTHIERTLFGEGSGDSIKNVVSTELGNIGTLQCWEHLQPLLKYHTYAQHEHIHIAAWPTNQAYVGWEPWSFCNEAAVIASRMYAIESGAFTIVATQCHTQKTLETLSEGVDKSEASHMAQVGGGFTAIYGPDGRKLTPDITPDWEGILYADCDFEQIRFAKSVADPVGHYSRPDLFQLHVDTTRKEHIVYKNDTTERSTNMLYMFKGVGVDSIHTPAETSGSESVSNPSH